MSTHLFSGSELIDIGRLLLLIDDFQPSSAFNSAHVASLSESGVSRDTVKVIRYYFDMRKCNGVSTKYFLHCFCKNGVAAL